MISFNLLGRFGRLANQMFQYAALLCIARRRGFEFCIPPSDAGDLWREHQLFQAFDLPSLKAPGINEDAPRLRAQKFNFDPEIAYACPDDVDLLGWFQSEKYFLDYAGLIRTEFAFREDVTQFCRQAIDGIGPETISLHVRRADYVELSDIHPPCDISYYRQALARVPGEAPVLVFSDDLDWCRAQSLFRGDRFLFSEGRSNIEDMCLMSMCRSHIIANSSFSWWGAWLDPDPGKIVIAPTRWFGTTGHTSAYDTSDLVPEAWIRI